MRAVHAVFDGPEVDLIVDGVVQLTDSFEAVTPYRAITSGNHSMVVRQTGTGELL